MGYSHYWNHTRKFSVADWTQVKDVIGKIISTAIESGTALSIDHGQSPISSHGRIMSAWSTSENGTDFIQFNGHPQACETFTIYRTCPPSAAWHDKDNKGFDFCKTGLAPYDKVVTASLIALTSIFPKHISASSDGSLSDWKAGMELAHKALGSNINLRYPFKMAFKDQWQEDILFGASLSLALRKDGALCLISPEPRIVLEFSPEKSAELLPYYRDIALQQKGKTYDEIVSQTGNELKKLKNGGKVIGGIDPVSQILGIPD